ncbi:MAG TPA: RDD family protein [Caldimonas sp.]
MIAAGDTTGAPVAGPGRTPSLARRMACFVYEATLLFGVALIPGVIGAIFFAQAGQRHPLQSDTVPRLFALVLYGVYFVWLWSARGQTLAMQTWRIRVVTAAGDRLTQGRALARYVACCCAWFAPATLVAAALHLPPWPSLGAVAAGIVVYALSALAAPERQFWHDLLCRTRLVDVRERAGTPAVRPRPR